MIPIELKKRYTHSREEDITDAFMRGYQACAAQGGDAEMDNCQAQAPQNYMQQSRHNDGTDLISRADAIEAVCKAVCEDDVSIFPECDQIKYCDEIQALLALPSAEAKPTVIRSKTLLPTKDFKEWAKRVRDGNPNVIVIPCDAEVVSADAVYGEWLDGWEVIRELSETRCMYNCFDENDRPMYEAMTSAIDIVRQMIGGDTE